jgi:LysM repeat protein
MSKKKYLLKNKPKFFIFLFFISLIVSTVIYTASVSGYKEPEYQSIIINSGDTLWSIAEKYSQNNNIREYIYNVKKINNLDSSIVYENTAIIVPLEK